MILLLPFRELVRLEASKIVPEPGAPFGREIRKLPGQDSSNMQWTGI